jgi:hypothetical protein
MAELTIKQLAELFEGLEDGRGQPSEIMVMMTDEQFETAKAKGLKVTRVNL